MPMDLNSNSDMMRLISEQMRGKPYAVIVVDTLPRHMEKIFGAASLIAGADLVIDQRGGETKILKSRIAPGDPCAVQRGTDCPDCEGAGWRQISEAGCCGRPTRTGECCGNAIEVPGTEQCSTCCGSGKIITTRPDVAMVDDVGGGP